MATDFYQRQSDARRSTYFLVAAFALAVVLIVGSVVAITYYILNVYLNLEGYQTKSERWLIPAYTGSFAFLLILGGTLYKVITLRRGGGARIAESLRGRRLCPNATDPVERRLLNVVEEMAIASGTPAPPVFLINENAINAFAAGYSPSDAVLGVTFGCAKHLSRDELQGVIAHEFSHVLNGDMRMNIKLIGVLHGILLIGLMGQMLLRAFVFSGRGRSRSRRGNNDGGGQLIAVILLIAVVAIVLGFIGTFFGNLIKAAVSRQREFLADASAVQFTRNPSGIAGALKRIGGSSKGSRLKTANAAEISHMFFSQGVWEGVSGLWATHPPLSKRILAIEPNWNGAFLDSSSSAAVANTNADTSHFASNAITNTDKDIVPASAVSQAHQQVGQPTTRHRKYAADLIQQIPRALVEALHEPYAARAVIYGLLIDRKSSLRDRQRAVLAETASPDVMDVIDKLQPTIDALDVRVRLPLIELALPALKSMSPNQFKEFANCFGKLVKADDKIDLFEWMLSKVLMRHLRSQYLPIKSPPIRYYGLGRLSQPCAMLLSAVAFEGNPDATAREAFERGAAQLPELTLTHYSRNKVNLDALQTALKTLQTVAAKHRGRLIDACATAINADDNVTWQEAELLRGISDLLDCPMPPLIVEAERS